MDPEPKEGERDLERLFRGEAPRPSGMDALRELGFGAALDALPRRLLRAWEVFLDGREILRVEEPSAALGDRALRVVSPPHPLRLLIEAARSAPLHPHGVVLAPLAAVAAPAALRHHPGGSAGLTAGSGRAGRAPHEAHGAAGHHRHLAGAGEAGVA